MKLFHAGFGEIRAGKPEAIDDVSLSGQGTSYHICRVDDWRSEQGKKRIGMIIHAVALYLSELKHQGEPVE